METATSSLPGGQIRLRDRRHLAYTEYGDPQGKPVFFFHDTPGSRLFNPDSSVAASSGARVIAIDRPGFGRSDAKRGRKIVDWPNDVLQLADALNIERFAVIGYSAGGPYAAACAAKFPERLTAAGLISSMAPMDNPQLIRGMQGARNLFFSLDRHFPPLAKLGYRMMCTSWQHNPDLYLKAQTDGLSDSEKARLLVPDMKAMLIADLAESVRAGTEGISWDLTLLARPWGFNLHTITAKVFIWHGDRDHTAPLAMGKRLASGIPHSKAVFFPGESHWTIHTHWQEILAALTQKDAPPRVEAPPAAIITEVLEEKPKEPEAVICSESSEMAKPDTPADADQVLKPALEVIEPVALQTTICPAADSVEALPESSPKPESDLQPVETLVTPLPENSTATVAEPIGNVSGEQSPASETTKPDVKKVGKRRDVVPPEGSTGVSSGQPPASETAKPAAKRAARRRNTVPGDASTEPVKPAARKSAKRRSTAVTEASINVSPEPEPIPETARPVAEEAIIHKIAVIEAMREGRFESVQPAQKSAEPTPKKSLSSLST